MWELGGLVRGSSCQRPRFLRVPESQRQPRPEERMVRCQSVRAQPPYHLALRAQGHVAPPSRDPAEVRGLAAQCGAVGGAVAGVQAIALA